MQSIIVSEEKKLYVSSKTLKYNQIQAITTKWDLAEYFVSNFKLPRKIPKSKFGSSFLFFMELVYWENKGKAETKSTETQTLEKTEENLMETV